MKNKLYKVRVSGFVISLIFHATAFFIAGLFVVFTVLPKEEPEFKAPPVAERPKMKLKKPKVKIKKSSQPKPSSRIVAKVKTAKMPEIQIPDLVGTGEGLLGGLGMGGDFMDIPDIGETTVFGSESSVGNDFEGHLYQLSHNRSGGAASMDREEFRDLLYKYVMKGWDDSIFDKYYRFPKKLYATHFMVPPIPSPMGPDAFGAPEMECYYMFAVYKGKLVYHKDIKIRFWGMGDAYLFVNVDGKEVLVSGLPRHRERFNWWLSDAPEDNIYKLGYMPMSVGDWIELKAGEPVDMKVLFGEWLGDKMCMGLLVEVEGEDYPSSYWNGPLLPIFKTEHLTWDKMTEICKYLPEDECSLTNGPAFSDFESPPKVFSDDYGAERAPAAVAVEDEPALRQWAFDNGEVLEAEFKQMLFDKVVLKKPDGSEIKVSLDRLEEESRSYVRLRNPPDLDIEFSRKSRQRYFPPDLMDTVLPPEGSVYQFTAKVRQKTSSRTGYDYPLTVEFFAIGDQIMAKTRVLLDRKVATFTLSEENDFSFNLTGSEVKVLDFPMNGLRVGTRYGGYLVVVRDTRGVIIAHKASSKNLYENLENLSRLKVGWYFDDDCRRCLPERPRHY